MCWEKKLKLFPENVMISNNINVRADIYSISCTFSKRKMSERVKLWQKQRYRDEGSFL